MSKKTKPGSTEAGGGRGNASQQPKELPRTDQSETGLPLNREDKPDAGATRGFTEEAPPPRKKKG